MNLYRSCDKIIVVINMEIPQRKLNRLSEYDYGQEGAYFVTLCTQNRSRLFQMELPTVGNDLCVVPYNGLCAVPEGAGDRNGTTRRSFPTFMPVGNGLCAVPILRRRVQHVFDEDAISRCGIVNKDMSSLKELRFGGTMEQWNAIVEESNWSDGTGAFTVYCTDGEISK